MLESIKEEMHQLRTDKLIFIVCLVIPLLVNFMIGWEFNQGTINHVPMAIVDYDNSQLSRQIISYFATNDAFDVKYYIQDQATLQTLLDRSQVRVGMVIPKDFSANVTSLRSPTILMFYDGSHMSMTSIAKTKASEILLTTRVGACIKQIQGRLGKSYDEAYAMAMPVSFENRTLYNPTKNFNYFMTPGYGTIICQLGIGLMAAVCVHFHKDEKKRVLGYIVGKIFFYGVLGSIAILINLFMQICVFKIPCRGSIIVIVALSILFMFAIASLSVAISAWINNGAVAMAVIGLLLIPNTIMAGYTWPLISMRSSYQWMAQFIPFAHYGDNIRDLLLKGSMTSGFSDIIFLVGFVGVMSFIATVGGHIDKHRKPREVFHR